jgi:hypothetical protein
LLLVRMKRSVRKKNRRSQFSLTVLNSVKCPFFYSHFIRTLCAAESWTRPIQKMLHHPELRSTREPP